MHVCIACCIKLYEQNHRSEQNQRGFNLDEGASQRLQDDVATSKRLGDFTKGGGYRSHVTQILSSPLRFSPIF